MMDADYGNIVYGSGIPNQMHQNLPTEELIMNNPNVAVKDAEYPSRESIITTNLSNTQVDGVYQQNASLDNGQGNLNEIVEMNQFMNSADNGKVEDPPLQSITDTVQQLQAIEEVVPIDPPKIDTSMDEPTEAVANSVLEPFESGTTTSLQIEKVVEDVDAPVATTSKKDNEVDQNQCRVCLSKDNLVNIFSFEKKSRICDIIMTICTTVKIIEKDYLPHYICPECLDKLKIAAEFKLQCEQTDTELRKKLKRSKNKVRGGGRFLLIDCEMSSGSDVDNKDDDEFQISDVVESDPDSDASFKIGKRKSTRVKKKTTPKRKAPSRVRTPSAKAKVTPSVSSASKRSSKPAEKPAPVESKRIKHDVVYIEALPELSDDEADEKNAPKGRARRSNVSYNTPKSKPAASQPSSSKTSKIPHKKRAIVEMIDTDEDNSKTTTTTKEPAKSREHTCTTCNKTLPSWNALKEHRKTHSGETFACNICNKPFKQKISLDAHIQKHKEDESRTCKPCNKPFASKLELRKHQQAMHEDQFTFECNTCKRTFTAKARLDKHKEGKCPGFDTSTKKKSEVEVSSHLGRDLFKCVAPLTTTYWSDSFSE